MISSSSYSIFCLTNSLRATVSFHLSVLLLYWNSISTHFYLLSLFLSSSVSCWPADFTLENKYEASLFVSYLFWVWWMIWIQNKRGPHVSSDFSLLLLLSSLFHPPLPLQKTVRKVRGVVSHFSDILPHFQHFLLLSPPPPAKSPILFICLIENLLLTYFLTSPPFFFIVIFP